MGKIMTVIGLLSISLTGFAANPSKYITSSYSCELTVWRGDAESDPVELARVSITHLLKDQDAVDARALSACEAALGHEDQSGTEELSYGVVAHKRNP